MVSNNKKTMPVVFAAYLLLTSCGYGPMGSHMGYGDGMGGYYGYGGVLMWVLLLLVAAAAVYFFLQQNRKSDGSMPGASETPLDILKKRYARGEIDTETFERMKKDIEG